MARLWGDGFADDGPSAFASMVSWDACSTDEYAVLFPQLVPSDGRLPAAPLAHLASCVAARAARLARFDPAPPVLGQPGWGGSACTLERAWFTGESALVGLLRAAGLMRTPAERVAAERRLLALLDGLLAEVRRGLVPDWSEDREAWFAFGSGIHSAYLWPESAVSPSRCLTAAWLGHLDRGRAALMPEAVADYLLDAVLDPVNERDRPLAAMIPTREDALRLRRVAAARLGGVDSAVRFGNGVFGATVRSLRSAAFVRGDALEHA